MTRRKLTLVKLGRIGYIGILLLTILFSETLINQALTQESRTWYVDDDLKDFPNADFTKIQDAVNAANDGDIIIVYPGTYIENIDIEKQLTIKSEGGAASTIVQSKYSNDHVFEVRANHVNISGFTITDSNGVWYYPGSGIPASGVGLYGADRCVISNNNISENDCGIHLQGSSNTVVSDNDLASNEHGIYLENSSNNTISNNRVADTNSGNGIHSGNGILLYSSGRNTIADNEISSNAFHGIYMEDSWNNTIANNKVDSNGEYGIYLKGSKNATLINNAMSENKYNFGIDGWDISDFVHNIDTSNKVNGRPIYYLVNKKNLRIPDDAGYVGIVNSSDIIVEALTLTNNGQGVLLAFSKYCKVQNVNASSNEYGISLYESESNTITDSNILSNQENIQLVASNSNMIKNNGISDAKVDGVCISTNSNDNTITSNELLNGEVGVLICESSGNILENNLITGNKGSGVGLGAQRDDCSNNQIRNNVISDNDVGIALGGDTYRLNYPTANVIQRNIISRNNTGILLIDYPEANIIKENSISYNKENIFLDTSSKNVIISNNITGGDYGIHLAHGSDNNRIDGNEISECKFGIYFSGSIYYSSLLPRNNTLIRNTVSSNEYGIYIDLGENNLIYLNTFQNNVNHAYAKKGQNIWSSTESISYTYHGRRNKSYLGNYWSSYTSTDKDKNGIWDSHYTVGVDKDDYPLVSPFESYFHTDLWLQIVGRDEMRIGREGYYRVVYGNSGNIDAHDCFLVITLPPNLKYNVDVPWPPKDIEGIDFTGYPKGIETDSGIIIPIVIPSILSSTSNSFSLKLISQTAVSDQIKIKGDLGQIPTTEEMSEMLSQMGYEKSFVDECVDDIKEWKNKYKKTKEWTEWASKEAEWSLFFGYIPGPIGDIINGILTLHTISSGARFLTIATGGPLDPNDKSGSIGSGSEHFISTKEPVIYTIFFENLENATAPAWKVKIVDQLDQNLDWESFSFSSINVAGETIDIPEGSSEISRTIRMRVEPWDGKPEAEEVDLEIKASSNSTTGIVEWELTGRDITTGEPTDFLVPNTNPPKGEGYVSFSIKPKRDLDTGTKIRNKAAIAFNVNSPMDTPEVFNTIDSEAPESWVEPLPQELNSWEFEVKWNGNDNSSGIKDYSIYVSMDDMPYRLWILHTIDTSSTFIGEPGHTYAFYSIARDNVGNMEEGPDEPDAVTTIHLKGCYIGAYLGCGGCIPKKWSFKA